MSLEGVTAAAAEVIAGVAGVKASYTADPLAQPNAKRVPGSIADTPVVITNYETFELTAGSPEHLGHILRADIWVRARTSSEAEREYLPIASGIIAAMRSKVGLYGEATLAKVIRGGPPRNEQIGEGTQPEPFMVFPVYIRVQELTVQAYSLA